MSNNEEVTRKKFNHLKKYYDETWDNKQHTLHVGLFKKNSDSLELAYRQATDFLINGINNYRSIDNQSKILDVGCGTGRTVIELCEKYGCVGVGVDLSDEQITDARRYLKKINQKRVGKKMPPIQVDFKRASGSELEKVFKKDELFTHVISQDAILLVENKVSLFENIYRLLVPGGVLAVADFLSEEQELSVSAKNKKLIYELVNWNKSLSYNAYLKILKIVGLSVIKSEIRDDDMVLTYNKLSQKMSHHIYNNDGTYLELQARYDSIVSAVKSKQMGWGLFFAQKPKKKVALLTGTKPKSIGRYIANHLHKTGWEIWLYDRSASRIDGLNWHERSCDISNEKSVKKLLSEIKNLDLIMMLADSGHGHGALDDLGVKDIQEFINAKLLGTALLCKDVVSKFAKQKDKIKMIWCAGKTTRKPKNLIMYSMVNSGLASFVDELNEHYHDRLDAYYLSTNLTSPSTIGDEFIKTMKDKKNIKVDSPLVVLEQVEKILAGDVISGMINKSKDVL